jgi:hypothetical protein
MPAYRPSLVTSPIANTASVVFSRRMSEVSTRFPTAIERPLSPVSNFRRILSFECLPHPFVYSSLQTRPSSPPVSPFISPHLPSRRGRSLADCPSGGPTTAPLLSIDPLRSLAFISTANQIMPTFPRLKNYAFLFSLLIIFRKRRKPERHNHRKPPKKKGR